MSVRHQIYILTSGSGTVFASCDTCGRRSKQGSRASAEAWMSAHQQMVIDGHDRRMTRRK